MIGAITKAWAQSNNYKDVKVVTGILVNHDYHVVELNSLWLPPKIDLWLKDKMGPGDGTRWFYRHSRIFFVDPKDHLLFLLAWGSE
jgi:hypothetical protein